MANPSTFILTITITLFLSLSSTHNTYTMNCSQNDLKTLLNIKQSLNNPPYLSSWIPSTNCCTWFNIQCNAAGRVISLYFNKASIAAELPSAIGDLSALEALTVALTSINGTIPTSFAKLSHLSSLFIYEADVSGPIPNFLSNRKLQYLTLAFNKFSGPIPPSLAKLPYLGTLDLRYNQLYGSIPKGLFHRSKKGTDLVLLLAGNHLSGNVPKFSGDGNFRSINLSHNNLTGGLSFLSRPANDSVSIDVSWNMFRFNFTNVRLSPQVVYLDLSHNWIRGAIPKSLNELKDLRGLNLSYNKLCGEIPAGEVTAKFKSDSYEHNKCLCGTPLAPC